MGGLCFHLDHLKIPSQFILILLTEKQYDTKKSRGTTALYMVSKLVNLKKQGNLCETKSLQAIFCVVRVNSVMVGHDLHK